MFYLKFIKKAEYLSIEYSMSIYTHNILNTREKLSSVVW